MKTSYSSRAVIPATQCGHKICARFTCPQPEHVLRFFTSFRALPAIWRWRLFMWETFFFGTARRTESQISESRPGMVNDNPTGLKRVWFRTEELCRDRDHWPAAGENERSRGNICEDMVDGSIRRVMLELLKGIYGVFAGLIQSSTYSLYRDRPRKFLIWLESEAGDALTRSGLVAPWAIKGPPPDQDEERTKGIQSLFLSLTFWDFPGVDRKEFLGIYHSLVNRCRLDSFVLSLNCLLFPPFQDILRLHPLLPLPLFQLSSRWPRLLPLRFPPRPSFLAAMSASTVSLRRLSGSCWSAVSSSMWCALVCIQPATLSPAIQIVFSGPRLTVPSLLWTGQTGLGKSTLINTIFASHLIDSKGRLTPDEPVRSTTEIQAASHSTFRYNIGFMSREVVC